MKIILVIDRVVTGGAERILVDYYHYLESMGHEPYVFALSGNKEQSKWSNGLRISYGTPGDENNVVKKLFQQMLLLFKLHKLVKNVSPNAIFSFLEKSNLLTICVPTRKVKKIVSVHNVLSIQYKKIHNSIVRKLVYAMIKRAYNRCKNVVAVSKQVKDDLVANFGVKEDCIRVINNFVDRDSIQQKSIESIDDFVFRNDVKYIMNVGRFSDQKAQWKLIKAFSLYEKRATIPVELILIGAGEHTKKLKELIDDLGLMGKAHILPFNINPYKYMRKANLFVLSSVYEGFPIVLAEVSSLKIPFVGSKKSIPEEIFDDKSVWEKVVYENVFTESDFTTYIHSDEVVLSELLKNGIENECFRQMIHKHSEKWEEGNLKKHQFGQYNQLIGLNYEANARS